MSREAQGRTEPVERLAFKVSEAAASLGISESHCRNEIRRGALPARRIGRRIVVPLAALDRWLEREAS